MFLNISNKLKEQKDENQIKKLCDNLNIKIGKVLGFNPQFKCYGSKEQGGYLFYNKSRYYKSNLQFEFSFKIEYANQMGLIKEKEFNSDISDAKLDVKLYNRSYLFVVDIYSLQIDPKGKGIGTKVYNIFLEEIKSIKSIKKIMLYANNDKAINFWSKNRFRNKDIEDLKDKRINRMFYSNLIYDINN